MVRRAGNDARGQDVETTLTFLAILTAFVLICPVTAHGQAPAPQVPEAASSFQSWTALMRDPLSGNREQDLARLNKAREQALTSAFLKTYPQVQGTLLTNLDRIISTVTSTPAGQAYGAAVNESAGAIANLCQWVRKQLAAQYGGQDPLTASSTPGTTVAGSTSATSPTQPGPTSVNTSSGPGPQEGPTLAGVTSDSPLPAGQGNTGSQPPATSTVNPAGVPLAPDSTTVPPVANVPGTTIAPGGSSVQGVPQAPQSAGQVDPALSQAISQMGGSLEVVSVGTNPNDPNMTTVTIRIRPPGQVSQPQPIATQPQGPVGTPLPGPVAPQPQPQATDTSAQLAAIRAQGLQSLGTLSASVNQLLRDEQLAEWNRFMQWGSDRDQAGNWYSLAVATPENQQAITRLGQQFGQWPLANRFPAETQRILACLAELRAVPLLKAELPPPGDLKERTAAKVREIKARLDQAIADLNTKLQNMTS